MTTETTQSTTKQTDSTYDLGSIVYFNMNDTFTKPTGINWLKTSTVVIFSIMYVQTIISSVLSSMGYAKILIVSHLFIGGHITNFVRKTFNLNQNFINHHEYEKQYINNIILNVVDILCVLTLKYLFSTFSIYIDLISLVLAIMFIAFTQGYVIKTIYYAMKNNEFECEITDDAKSINVEATVTTVEETVISNYEEKKNN